MLIAIREHDLLPHFDGVEINHLEGDVIDLGLEPHCHEQRVMIGRFITPIETHERTDRSSIGEAHDIGWDEA